MKKSDIIAKLQSAFGVTRSEMLFALIVLLGLTVGVIIQLFRSPDSEIEMKRNNDLVRFLDSIAETNKSTYTGTDLKGNSFPDLKQGDTLVKSVSLYPQSEPKTNPDSVININTASLTELMKLPGVGRKTAEKIIEYRDKRLFRKVGDLMNVPSIGDKKFARLKDYIKVQ